MMKRKSMYLITSILICLMVSLTGCAGNNKDSSMSSTSDVAVDYEDKKDVNGGESDIATEDMATETEDGSITQSSTTTNNSGNNVKDSSRKLIRRINLDVETLEYDKFITSINSQITFLEGYIESSQSSGNNYNDEDGLRYCNLVVRIPKNKVDQFVNTVNENSNVVYKEESAEDVTLAYVDVESHKKSLTIEQERLLVLLEKAEKLEDIITLETRLSEVRYEIESYESKLRTYDNLVDYSTVTLAISEVKRITPVVEKEETIWERMTTGLSENLYDLKTGFTNFIIWFVINIPYFVIWAIIIIIIWFVYKVSKRRLGLSNRLHNQVTQKEDNSVEKNKKE